ncbi:22945_t:CDS:1, partial [Racocetra persica]
KKSKSKNDSKVEKKEKKQTKYQKFVQDNFHNLREKYETNGETLKAIAEMWKTSSENPKNESGFIENIN